MKTIEFYFLIEKYFKIYLSILKQNIKGRENKLHDNSIVIKENIIVCHFR